MSYFTDLGELYPSDWCSDLNPQGSCSPLKGIAKPMTLAALAHFQLLQRQINRLRAVAGKAPIGVDGRIGPGTVAAANEVSRLYGPGAQWTHADALALQADTVGPAFKAEADRRGVKVVADPRTVSPPSVPGPGGTVINPSNLSIQSSSFLGVVRSPLGLAALAIGGVLLYRATSGPVKRKPKRPALAAARKRRRAAKKRVTYTWF